MRNYLQNTERETKSEYESRLIATDKDGQSVETTILVKLRDENDNTPVFTRAPQEVDVEESKPTGSLIARLVLFMSDSSEKVAKNLTPT